MTPLTWQIFVAFLSQTEKGDFDRRGRKGGGEEKRGERS